MRFTTVRIRPCRTEYADSIGGADLVEAAGKAKSVEVWAGGNLIAFYRHDTAEVLWKTDDITISEVEIEAAVEAVLPLSAAVLDAEMDVPAES